MNEILNDFVFGNDKNVSSMENETLEPQTNGYCNDLQWILGNASQNQIIRNFIDKKTEKAVDNAVIIVENRIHDAILITMDYVLNPQDQTAVRSIFGSSRHGPNS